MRSGDISHVLVMAKAPRPGRVKTRLCSACTPQQAADIASAALTDTLATVVRCRADRRIIALDGEPGPWLPPGVEVIPQVSGPLETRLAAAWTAVTGPGVQIGMDTPQLSADLLDLALAQVADHDATIGRAEDGGWWAIGFRRPRPDAFDGVPMSTPDTGRLQLARLRDLDLTVKELPTLRDLDTVHDARAIADAVPESRTAAAVRDVWPEVSC